ncbi:MAG: N-6 DNA methylase, partial [Actinobacteria bacterium]|nr:N-6 DNA methylase [Actinomycetota bacterium]
LDLFAAESMAPEADRVVEPEALDPELASHRVGARHEQLLEMSGERKRGGVYYTPPDVVANLLTLALDPLLDACGDDLSWVCGLRILDPACGSGNFLSAAGDRIRQRLEALGVPRPEAAAVAYGECLVGIDIDQAAVDLCVTSLAHASHGTVTVNVLQGRIFCADALEVVAEEDGLFSTCSWQSLKNDVGAAEGFDLVIGNPPFLSQLASETARSEAYTARLRGRFGSAVAGLTDTAVLFLILAVEAAKAADGVACLIQPISVLSTRDASGAREIVLQRSGMRAAWICEDKVFDASVRVCAVVLVRGQTPPVVELLHNRAFAAAGSVAAGELEGPTWSVLLAATKGVPERQLRVDGAVRDLASATADFRDQYYGLRGCVVDVQDADDFEYPPLVTSGLLDPAQVPWGSRSTKFAKATFQYPRVDISRLEPRLQEWARSRLRPKLMLATQTKVLEAFVDASGQYLPSVPVLSITADHVEDLWCLGALLSSPPVTLLAARRHLGAALSSEALKLSASDVLDLPLPADRDAWSEAAQYFERATRATVPAVRFAELAKSARLMCEAFGLKDDAELMDWWSHRLPTRHAVR